MLKFNKKFGSFDKNRLKKEIQALSRFNFFEIKKQPLIGIDISSSSVKIVSLSKKENEYILDGYSIKPIPTGSIVDGNITDIDSLGSVVLDALNESSSSIKNVACCIPNSKTISKNINLPASIPETELEGQIQTEMTKHIPYALEEINLDFQFNKQISEEVNEFTVIATKSENIDSLIAVLELAELTPKIVDVEIYAVENALNFISKINKGFSINSVLGIVDIGISATKLSILDNGKLTYTREQTFGGKQLLNELQRSLGLSLKDSRELLRTTENIESSHQSIVENFMNSATQEIERALQLFYSSENAMQLDHIVLAGGFSSIKGLSQKITAGSGTQSFVISPFTKIAINKSIEKSKLTNDQPALLTAMGLAIRGLNE
tara:strand:+ start:4778 stop:5911 length:1134 start_codon:yes stop_codon:yes gene_type:complete